MKTEIQETEAPIARWDVIQRHFELLRHEPSGLWHARLTKQFPEGDPIVYDILSLLVANRAAAENAPAEQESSRSRPQI